MKYFESSMESQFNSRILKEDNKWLFYAEGYNQAIEIINKEIIGKSKTEQDFLIYPYCFLIRHFIELRIKEIINEGSKLLSIDLDPTKGKHDISDLWIKAEKILKSLLCQEYKNPPREIIDFINEFQNLDSMADSFRYPINKKGRDSIDANEINIKEISRIFNELKIFLNGLTDLLAVIKDEKDEMHV